MGEGVRYVLAAGGAVVLIGSAPSAWAADGLKSVDYGGVHLQVPRSWPVYDLDHHPATCVRYDRPAVYLGPGGPDQDCPSRVVGRTETLQLTRVKPDPAARRGRMSFAGVTVPDTVDEAVQVPVPAAGVLITGTYGSDRELLQQVLRRTVAVPGPGARTSYSPSPPASPPPLEPLEPPRQGLARAGAGFDTCEAPSLRTMRAWRPSYSVVNAYIGGAARGCGQPNLSAAWVRGVRRMGFRLIPTYVGLQAPCTRFHNRFSARNAAVQGRAAADDAVHRAALLGIPYRNPIYIDLEAYKSRASCRKAVLTFLDNWSVRLRRHGYVSGVYSSAGSGIRDLGHATGITKPKVIWFAHWDGRASVLGGPYLSDRWWVPHRRIKQYLGGHSESHGGIRLNIDTNAVDGPVY